MAAHCFDPNNKTRYLSNNNNNNNNYSIIEYILLILIKNFVHKSSSYNYIFSWYFGQMSRTEASDLLMGERECGTFLIRDSLSIQGDYVLCVR